MIITDIDKLKQKCDDVIESEMPDLILKLEKELNHSALMGRPGVGLAAPQIGIQKKAAIIRIPSSTNYSVNLINAKIVKAYDPFLFEGEGCLSIPNKTGTTKRFREIYVANNSIEPYNFIASGLLAVVIQHELDHLDGILFTEKLEIDNNFIKINNSKKDIGRNEECFCGSKLKYKKCHGR